MKKEKQLVGLSRIHYNLLQCSFNRGFPLQSRDLDPLPLILCGFISSLPNTLSKTFTKITIPDKTKKPQKIFNCVDSTQSQNNVSEEHTQQAYEQHTPTKQACHAF